MSGGELAGRLRERVTVERRAATRDALGGAIGDWIAEAVVAAAIVPARAGAAVVADAASGLDGWAVTVRSEADVRVGDRLVWRERRLSVVRATRDPTTPDRLEIFSEEER
jgi:head-tail adaptor